MKCKYCGQQLEKGIEVCKECGNINKSIFGSRNLNKKIIITAAALVVAVIVAFGAVFAVTGRSDIDVRLINEDEGEYLLVNVPKNHAFDIEIIGNASEENFVVYDIYGDEIVTDNRISDIKVSIKAPEGGYEEGDVYMLDLNGHGAFIDEELKNAKRITFVIESKEKEEIIYKENVAELKGNEVDLGESTITVGGKYEAGDIIVADTDNDKIDEVYKLIKARNKDGKTIAEYTEPSADEVFEKLDVFYYDEVNFKEAEIDEEAFVGVLEEMGVLEAIVDEVYAESDSKIKIEVTNADWKSAKASYQFECTLKDPANESRQVKVSFGVADKLMVKADDGLAMANNSLMITSGLDFKVEGEDKESVEKSISKALEHYQSDLVDKADEEEYDIPLVPVKIPIAGPVYASVKIGLTAEVGFSAEFNSGAEASAEFTQGIVYDYHRFKVIKKYADVTGDIEAYMMVKGELDAFAGAYVDLGIGIPGIDIGVGAKGGPYLEGEGCFAIEGIPKDIAGKGYYSIEIGLMIAADAKIDVIGFDEKTVELANKKKQLFKMSEYLNLQQTSLEDTYYIIDDSINIGNLEATYYNLIEDNDITKEIKEYTLYIDNKEVKVEDGYIITKINEGKHEFKLKWSYDGDKFEEVKTIELTKFDPWGYFQSISFEGMSFGEIIEKCGPIVDTGEVEGGLAFQMQKGSLWAFFGAYGNLNEEWGSSYAPETWMKKSAECAGTAGTIKNILGFEESLHIDQLGLALGVDGTFKYFPVDMWGDERWFATKTVGGNEYGLTIYCDYGGYIDGDSEIEIDF